MARDDTLAKLPPLLAAHRFAMRHAVVPYALADLYVQAARGALARRREPWRSVDRPLPLPFRRSSDTLFVLGGGESINALPASAWDAVKTADSLGLNFWLLHELVPTAYVQEWIGPSDDAVLRERLQVRRKLLAARHDELDEVPVFFRTPARRRRHGRVIGPADVDEQLGLPRHQVVVTSDLNLLPLDDVGFGRTMRWAERCGFLRPRSTWHYLPTTRGTVLWTLLFALRLGYREMVLCGIDLHSTRYFYEDPEAPRVRHDLPRPPNVQAGAVHRTNDPAEPGPTMRDIIRVLRPLLADRGVSLSVAHPDSLLAADLPLHTWPHAVR